MRGKKWHIAKQVSCKIISKLKCFSVILAMELGAAFFHHFGTFFPRESIFSWPALSFAAPYLSIPLYPIHYLQFFFLLLRFINAFL